jgi:hypothetical protein
MAFPRDYENIFAPAIPQVSKESLELMNNHAIRDRTLSVLLIMRDASRHFEYPCRIFLPVKSW